MSEDIRLLADEIDCGQREFIDVIARITPEEWRTVTESEGWHLAAVASHVADGTEMLMRYARSITAGTPETPLTPEYLHGENAERAARNATLDQATVLARLRAVAEATVTQIRALRSEDLERSGTFVSTLPPMPLPNLIRVINRHSSSHLASIQAALGRQTART